MIEQVYMYFNSDLFILITEELEDFREIEAPEYLIDLFEKHDLFIDDILAVSTYMGKL